MSYLQSVSIQDATGDVAAVYQEITAAFGGVPAIIQLWSVSPFHLRQQWEFIKNSMQNEKLSGAFQPVMRMTVAQETSCNYCIDMNAGMLINMFDWSMEQVAATKDNPAHANLDDSQKAILLFVLKAVKDSKSITQADIDALHALDYSDKDIFEAAAMGTRMIGGDLLSNIFHVERDF